MNKVMECSNRRYNYTKRQGMFTDVKAREEDTHYVYWSDTELLS